jgi:Kef-type K+ transport system membrane component KefB
MPVTSFAGLALVALVGFAVPLVLGFVPALRLPSVVLEIVVGILIGPSVLHWVTVDQPIAIVSLIGLALLLFLSGLELDLDRLRGRVLRVTGLAFLLSFGIALVVGYGLGALGLIHAPLLVAIILVATSLGIVIPLLKDAGEISSDFGQLTIAGASIADFGAIILLSLFFSRQATGIGAQLVLLGGFALLAIVVTIALTRTERSMRLSTVLLRLQDTTAQIRVRGAFVLLVAFAAFAERLGLEVILGTFIAGAILALVDRDQMMTHGQFRTKLEAVGFGIFIPIFFVTSGIRFDLAALLAHPSTIVLVPVFLVALLVIRGVPAVLYRPLVGGRRTLVAGLLQATSLPFIVAASQIGLELGVLSQATAAALIATGLLSVLIFPLGALLLLRGAQPLPASSQPSAMGHQVQVES